MLQWGKQAKRSPGSPHTKQSITQTCTAVLPDGKSTWQHMYLKAILLLRNNYKEGILRDSQITTKTFFSSCTAQQQAEHWGSAEAVRGLVALMDGTCAYRLLETCSAKLVSQTGETIQ